MRVMNCLHDLVGEPATKLMHPKYTNVKYVFLSIKIYEKHDFKGSQAKLAAYTWFFLYTMLFLRENKSAAHARELIWRHMALGTTHE